MRSFSKIEKTSEAIKKGLQALTEELNNENSELSHEEIVDKLQKAILKQEKLWSQIKNQSNKFNRLEKEKTRLTRENETIVSNNYLLEYKKKDLLVLADELEEANEEIEKKNKEIQEQADELAAQKDALEDQADYLHEANETITGMHTELQNQRDEILRKNEELISLNNEKNNLIGIVAHDLKSPLNQISGLITLIKMTADLEEEQAEYVDTMSDSVNRLNAMIAKILDVEAIESKKINLNIEKVDIAHIVENLTKNYEFTAKEKQLTLIADIEDDEAYSMIDNGFAIQVIENLLSNSIKFSPPNKKIFFGLTSEEDKWRVSVKDEGPGISEDDQKKLFGKFQKLSAKPTGNETSTGLGLSIVKKYVDAMGGKIWCESELGKGASFIVEFEKAK